MCGQWKVRRTEVTWGLIWEEPENCHTRQVGLSGRTQAIIRERNSARIGIFEQNKLKVHFKSFTAKDLKLLHNTALAPLEAFKFPLFPLFC